MVIKFPHIDFGQLRQIDGMGPREFLAEVTDFFFDRGNISGAYKTIDFALLQDPGDLYIECMMFKVKPKWDALESKRKLILD